MIRTAKSLPMIIQHSRKARSTTLSTLRASEVPLNRARHELGRVSNAAPRGFPEQVAARVDCSGKKSA